MMGKVSIYIKKYWEIIAAAIIGATVFIALYGTGVLDPTYVDWLMKGENDLSQHYYGWKMFRQDSWHFPFGIMENLIYPIKVSVIYTDSIPLLAILFKLVSPILPENFQYFGWYGIISFILQGGISALLLGKYIKSKVHIIIGSGFFILSPIALQRMFEHTSLAGNWLLLFLMIALVYRENIRKSNKTLVLFWSSAAILCIGIHFYYILMGGFIWLGFFWLEWTENRTVKQSIKAGLVYGIAAVSIMYILGGFSEVISPGEKGLGSAQFDLMGFINPMGYSALWKGIFESAKFESFAYLGTGIIILFLIAVGLRVIKKREFNNRTHIIIGLVGLLSLIFAMSNILTFDGNLVLEIPLPEIVKRIWSIFRATGRFSWIMFYFIMLFSICMTEKLVKKGIACCLLVICLCIQVIDLSGMIQTIQENYREPYRHESRLQDERWHSLAETGKYEHVVVITDFGHDLLYEFTEYAADYHMTINRFYLARSVDESLTLANIQRALESEEKNCIYIVAKQDTWMFEKYGIAFEILDNRGVGVKP